MGHKKPFSAEGNCGNCKFSIPLKKKEHWQAQYHSLVCKRFPPTGATAVNGDGPWSHESFVNDNHFCGEWEKEQ